MNKMWWEPQPTDEAWCNRVREDYPYETDGMSDDAIREEYADGNRYQTLWDHVGEAYGQFEALADAYLALKDDKHER
jgi:hypothetical protein